MESPKADRDALETFVAERTAVEPEFPALVEAHHQRRRLQRTLAGKRQELGLSQTEVARRMGTCPDRGLGTSGGDLPRCRRPLDPNGDTRTFGGDRDSLHLEGRDHAWRRRHASSARHHGRCEAVVAGDTGVVRDRRPGRADTDRRLNS
jgi:hypothetical protein